MDKLEVGQEFEFIEPAHVNDRVIAKGTRVRVGQVMTEVLEPEVMLVVIGSQPPETLRVSRHVVTLHCRRLQPS